MTKTEHTFPKSDVRISAEELERSMDNWLIHCQLERHSPHTIATRRISLNLLRWFLREHQYTDCGLAELRHFALYLLQAHESPQGRWNNPQLNKPLRPWTIKTYHNHLRTLFRWMVREEIIESSPWERVLRPLLREDQVQPFSPEQIKALIGAARRSRHSRRDEAIVRLLFDTGVRASELCGITLDRVNWDDSCIEILGKGNKIRRVYFGRKSFRALWSYLRDDKRQQAASNSTEPLFLADRGDGAGQALTRSGLFQLIERLGKVAGIHGTRCSPHTFRHSFAVEFLRGGGSMLALKMLLGHTTLKMTNRYVALAQADLQEQHRAFSPGDRFDSPGDRLERRTR